MNSFIIFIVLIIIVIIVICLPKSKKERYNTIIFNNQPTQQIVKAEPMPRYNNQLIGSGIIPPTVPIYMEQSPRIDFHTIPSGELYKPILGNVPEKVRYGIAVGQMPEGGIYSVPEAEIKRF